MERRRFWAYGFAGGGAATVRILRLPVEFPRLGFALCLPVRIGYVVDFRSVTGFDFHSSRLFSGKQMLHIFAFCGANPWFMNGLQMLRRRKDAVLSCQLSVVSDQPTAGQPSIQSHSTECFHCAPTEANYLQRQWSVDSGQPFDPTIKTRYLDH
jgi:hypothetical protein